MGKKIIPWEEYMPPCKIYGNLYFVGSVGGSSHLIATDEGLTLIDTGFPQTLYLLLESIRALGFEPKDIRHIIHTHGHYDHIGATRALIELYHPVTYLGAPDLDYVTGKRDLALAEYFDCTFIETFTPDVLIGDGERRNIGGTEFYFLMTPGHTEGTLSVFFEIDGEQGRKRVGMFGGAGMNSMGRQFLLERGLPLSLQDNFPDVISRLEMERVDIHLGNHIRQNRMPEKLERMAREGGNPFIDPDEWCDYLGRVRRTFARMLEGEK